MNISVVIPTRNRIGNLKKLLDSLSLQSNPPVEVIIVDSSDTKILTGEIERYNLPIKIYYSSPSVCVQRNIGIRESTSNWIFTCDDDIVLPPDYLEKLANHAEKSPSAIIVTGLVLERDLHQNWTYEYPISSAGLIWNFIFQLPVWSDLSSKPDGILKNFYKRRKNTFSLAGWPLITHFERPYFKASIYGLGASMIRKEFLLKFPFDETLDPNGIGDHYGIAINLRDSEPIHVLMETCVYHYKNPVNRLNHSVAYSRRIFALDYFMRKSNRFNHFNFIFLLWSLIGNFLRQTLSRQWNLALMSVKVFFLLLINRNPYSRGMRNADKQ